MINLSCKQIRIIIGGTIMKFKALLLSTVLVGTLAACGSNDQVLKTKLKILQKQKRLKKQM